MKQLALPKSLLAVLSLLFMSGILSGIATSADSLLVGIWNNLNENTRACPQVEITVNNNGDAEFVWWGKTSPQDTRYGPLPLKITGNGKSATAEHITNFSVMEFNLKLRGKKLIMKIDTVYTDDSGRGHRDIEEEFEKSK